MKRRKEGKRNVRIGKVLRRSKKDEKKGKEMLEKGMI